MSHSNLHNSNTNNSLNTINEEIEQLSLELNNLNIENNQADMAIEMPVLKKEFLDMVPEFHGETELLSRFLEITEKLVTKFYNRQNPDDFQNEYLMGSIISKIKGEAAINVASSNVKTFAELKTALLNAYGDKRDLFTLNIELCELKQNSIESSFDYYNKIQKKLQLCIAYINNHGNANEKTILIKFVKEFALKILLRGLREPLGSFMRTKNPTSLTEALGMLTNDFQFVHQNANMKMLNPNKNVSGASNANNSYQNYKQNTSNVDPNSHRKYFPKLTYNPPRTNNYSNKPNYGQTNVFRPQQNKTLPKPTPMSISTNNTQQQFANKNYYKKNYHVTNNIHEDDEENVEQDSQSCSRHFPDENPFLEEIASETDSN